MWASLSVAPVQTHGSICSWRYRLSSWGLPRLARVQWDALHPVAPSVRLVQALPTWLLLCRIAPYAIDDGAGGCQTQLSAHTTLPDHGSFQDGPGTCHAVSTCSKELSPQHRLASAVPSSSAPALVGGRRGELERRGEFVFARGAGDPGAEVAGRPEGDPGSLQVQPWPRTQGDADQSQQLTGTQDVYSRLLPSY